MGKSPGKWIKGIFSRRTSKSNLSKGKELSRSASEKPARVSSKEPKSYSVQEEPIISSPLPIADVDKVDNSNFEKGSTEKLASDEVLISSTKQDGDIPTVSDVCVPNENEKAAIIVQASLRCYQARHAFEHLKGVIRLQSCIRGHLVRRQAISTLFCVQGIVKFQAIARGRLVRQSSIGNEQWKRQSFVAKDAKQPDSELDKDIRADTLSKNAFIHKLLSSSPTAMLLHLQYGPGEPNSAWAWLLRWSVSQVWAPNPKQKQIYDSKHQIFESEETKPKRKCRVHSASLENGPNRAEIDVEKRKRHPKKLSKSDKPVDNLAEPVLNSNLTFEDQSKLISNDFKDDSISNESYKLSRRISLPAKNDDEKSTPENVKRVPSYMAKTASSKAKVRAQVSPRLGLDHAADKNILTRRYSLPSGKLSSSPRIHMLVQANAREGINIDRSLSSSRDVNDKVIQADWKR